MTRNSPWRTSRIATTVAVLAGIALGGVLGTPASATDTPPNSYSPIGLPVYSESMSASDDTYVDPGAPTVAQGQSPVLYAGDEATDGRRALVKFTTPALPANASNVSLFLVLSQVGGGATGPLKVYGTSSDWSGSTLTATSAPPLGPLHGRAPSEETGFTTSIMVSGVELVPGQELSFAISSTLGGPGAIDLASLDNTDPALRPQLLVTYLLPPDCSTSSLLVPSCGAWFGSTANLAGTDRTPTDAVARQESELGRRLDVVHVYHSLDQDWPTPGEVSLVGDPVNRRLLMVNWKPENGSSWAQVASGSSDAWIDTVAARIVARLGTSRFFLTIHHEPENDLRGPGSGYTPADYLAMYRHVVQRLRADGVSSAVMVWDVMGYPGWGDQGLYDQLYPGDDVVDWIGYDPYSHAGEPLTVFANRPGQHFPGFYSWATTNHASKPLMLAEFGVESAVTSDRTAVFSTFSDDARVLPAIKAFIYFNHAPDGTTNGYDFSYDSNPDVLVAARGAFTDSHFIH